MANYDMAVYHLRFSNDYKKIEVVDSDNAVTMTYPLDNASNSVSVTVDGDDYAVAEASPFSEATNVIDVGAGATLAFDGLRMGGNGIVDLRDMRSGGPFLANYSYDLECTTFFLKYVAGPFALKLQFDGTGCLDWEEVKE